MDEKKKRKTTKMSLKYPRCVSVCNIRLIKIFFSSSLLCFTTSLRVHDNNYFVLFYANNEIKKSPTIVICISCISRVIILCIGIIRRIMYIRKKTIKFTLKKIFIYTFKYIFILTLMILFRYAFIIHSYLIHQGVLI